MILVVVAQDPDEKEGTMSMQTFINLSVKDLSRATEFFTKVGFSFDEQFTDENATRMIISEAASVMLSVEPSRASSHPRPSRTRRRPGR
jgi:predicted lactoylglutathione lyase